MSKISSVPLSQLNEAPVILIGYVRQITVSASAGPDDVQVDVAGVIRGQVTVPTFSIALVSRGQKAHDPELHQGAKAIFFLKSIQDGKAILAESGSVAVLPDGNFYFETHH